MWRRPDTQALLDIISDALTDARMPESSLSEVCSACRSLDFEQLLDNVQVIHHTTFEELRACTMTG